ncbi:MAG: hypothetical protein GY915_02790 [bacterium]|nr:hypothetical protein [bacterium]
MIRNIITVFLKSIPILTLIFCLLVEHLLPSFRTQVLPELSVICVYYWSVYTPLLLPIWSLALISLSFDVLSGVPFGVTATVFFTLKGVALSQRDTLFERDFLNLWAGFALCAFIGTLTKMGLLFFLYPPVPSFPIWTSYALTVMVYPLISRFLIVLHGRLFVYVSHT